MFEIGERVVNVKPISVEFETYPAGKSWTVIGVASMGHEDYYGLQGDDGSYVDETTGITEDYLKKEKEGE